MAYEPPVAVYDACVLYPFHLRNLLVQCAVDRLVEARWTDEIHDEWIRSLAANAPATPLGHLIAARDLMNAALPNATVTNYQAYISSVTLPDPDDRHVVAAGVAAGASLIITWNVKDFPVRELARHKLRKQTPDAFLMELYAAVPGLVIEATRKARANLRKSKVSGAEFVGALERQKLKRFSAAVRRHLGQI
jgi:predicted nucleic acid-binding protein